MNYLIPCLLAFVLTAILVPLVIRFATACKCLDIPGKRHFHKKATPRWGGLAFFTGVLPFLFFLREDSVMLSYFAASSLLVVVGLIDDRYGLNWKVKIAANAVAATMVIFGGNAVITHVGTFGAIKSVELGWLSIPFTYFSIIGVTNAINLVDGLNGLAGGVSLIGFLFIGIAAASAGNVLVALVCFVFVGALGAFLLYNFPNAKIFMGDSGSLFLGFSLSLMAIHLTQSANSPVEPMMPVVVLLLPIFDALRVLFVRLLGRRNPFRADKSHLHHLIVRKNISPVTAVLLLWSLAALFGGMGLMLANRTSGTYLIFALYASLFLSLCAVSLAWRRRGRTTGLANVYEAAHQLPDAAVGKLIRTR